MIPILDGNLIQLAVVYTRLRESSFFLINKTGAPELETLGQIKPLSNRSFSCSFNYLNSVGDFLYGELEIRPVSG